MLVSHAGMPSHGRVGSRPPGPPCLMRALQSYACLRQAAYILSLGTALGLKLELWLDIPPKNLVCASCAPLPAQHALYAPPY